MIRILFKDAYYKGLDYLDALPIDLDYLNNTIYVDLMISMRGLYPSYLESAYFESINNLQKCLLTFEGLNLLRTIVPLYGGRLRILFENNGFIGEFQCNKIILLNSELCAIDILTLDNRSRVYLDNIFLKHYLRNKDYELELHSCLPLTLFQHIYITDVLFDSKVESLLPVNNHSRKFFREDKQKNENNLINLTIEKDLNVGVNYIKKFIKYSTTIYDTNERRNREGIEEVTGYAYNYYAIISFETLDELFDSIKELDSSFVIKNKRDFKFYGAFYSTLFDLGNTQGLKVSDLQNLLSVVFSINSSFISC